MDIAQYSSFESLDIRVGTVIEIRTFDEARKPAYKLTIDFGKEIGQLHSSAQITQLYSLKDVLNRQVIAVVNFPPKQIANFISECLVLGVYAKDGVVLLSTERPCANGDKLG